MPFTQHPLFGAWMGGLTVTKYLGGLCLFYALFRISQTSRIPDFLATPQSKCFMGFVVMALSSFILFGHSSQVELSPFALYSSLLLQFFITPVIVDSTAKLRNVFLAAIASIAFASLYVIREWQVYHNVYSGFRPGAVVGDSNYFGVSVVACLPVSYALMVLPGPRWQRLLTLGCVFITLVALMLGASRGGFIGLTVAGLFIVMHSTRPVRNFLAIAAVILPISLAVPTSPVRRLMNPTYSDDEAVTARTTAWKAGRRMIKTHPLMGVGLGNFKPLSASYEDPGDEVVVSLAHNTYIELAAELGIPGLILFVATQIATFFSLSRFRKSARRAQQVFLEQAALGLQAGLVGCAIALCFVSGQVQKMFWFSIFLTTCLPALAAQTSSRRRKSVRAPGTAARAPGTVAAFGLRPARDPN